MARTTDTARRRAEDERGVGSVVGVVDSIIESHAKSYADLPDKFEIRFPLPDQEDGVLYFHRFKGFASAKTFESAFVDFYQLLTDDERAVLPEWKAYKHAPIEEAVAAFTIHFYSAEPTKISVPQAFSMIVNPGLVEIILSRIDMENSAEAGMRTVRQIRKAKKKPKQTQSTPSSSALQETSTGATTTS